MIQIVLEKICYIIAKAREFDVKEAPEFLEGGSNPSDEQDYEILEDYPDDPTYQELIDALSGLNVDELTDVLALTWIGRGDFSAEELPDVRAQARDSLSRTTITDLAGTPILADYLEEALSQLGYSCQDFEVGRM
jgi:hypothetical protein